MGRTRQKGKVVTVYFPRKDLELLQALRRKARRTSFSRLVRTMLRQGKEAWYEERTR